MTEIPRFYQIFLIKLGEKPEWKKKDLGLLARDFRLSQKDIRSICRELETKDLLKISQKSLKLILK